MQHSPEFLCTSVSSPHFSKMGKCITPTSWHFVLAKLRLLTFCYKNNNDRDIWKWGTKLPYKEFQRKFLWIHPMTSEPLDALWEYERIERGKGKEYLWRDNIGKCWCLVNSLHYPTLVRRTRMGPAGHPGWHIPACGDPRPTSCLLPRKSKGPGMVE